MKSIYVVCYKFKSNHTTIVAAFESMTLAETYMLHKQGCDGSEYKKFIVKEVPVLDGTPEINKIMLGYRK